MSKPFELFTEVNGDISMRIRDFLEICKVQENLHDPNIDHIVKYKNLKGGDEEFDAKNKTLYMIDFDLKGMLPETYDDFMQKFLIPELLPGGNACMMHSVSSLSFYLFSMLSRDENMARRLWVCLPILLIHVIFFSFR